MNSTQLQGSNDSEIEKGSDGASLGSNAGAPSRPIAQRSTSTKLGSWVRHPVDGVRLYAASRRARRGPWQERPSNYSGLLPYERLTSGCPAIGVGFNPYTYQPELIPVNSQTTDDDDICMEVTTYHVRSMCEPSLQKTLDNWVSGPESALCKSMLDGGKEQVQRLLQDTVDAQKFSKVDLVYLDGEDMERALTVKVLDRPRVPIDPEQKRLWGKATGLSLVDQSSTNFK